MTKAFNMIDEPWIRAMDDAGRVREMGLLEALRRAHEIRALAGELPTQDTSVLRVLLAVVYQACVRVDDAGLPLPADDADELFNRWRALWDRRRFSVESVERYLRRHGERFWLFHPETPFFQVAGLHTQKAEVNSVSQLICDLPSREDRRFLTNRSGREATSLAWGEAARWLVHLHAWDYAGKKASIVGGDPNGGGTGWLGKLGVVYAERGNLFETLLINAILFDEAGNPVSLGRPCWEQDAKPVRKVERHPEGYVDLLTWQSRRALLFAACDRVTGVLSSYGDVFEKENTFTELMSGWHRSTMKGEENKFIPNLHAAGRSVWRDLSALLPAAEGAHADGRRPGIIAWVAWLKKGGVANLDIIRLRAVGLEYGTMQAVVNELISDGLDVNSGLLTQLGADWLPRIYEALEKTQYGVMALGHLARRLVEAAGGSDKGTLKGAGEEAWRMAYAALDEPFRAWLVGIDPAVDDVQDKYDAWLETVRRTLVRLAEQLVADAGERVLTGVAKFNEKTNRLVYENAFTARAMFDAALRKGF